VKTHQKPKLTETERNEPIRFLALSDGLFATVLTLLVLDLRLPEALSSAGETRTAFIRWLGPHLFSYVLTFWVAGLYWLAHHRNFEKLIHTDRGLLSYNLLFLFFVGLFPFSTATLSLGNFQSNEYPFYWAIYAVNILGAGVLLEVTRWYAISHHLAMAETTSQQRRYVTVRHLVTPAVFLLSIIAEYLFPQAFLGPYTLIVIPFLMWGIDHRLAPAMPDQVAQPSSLSEVLWRAGTIVPWLVILRLAVWAMAS
jgi:uncharacterized membrane protein